MGWRGLIAGVVDDLNQILDADERTIKEDRSLPAVEIHFGFMDAGQLGEFFLDARFAAVAMHTRNSNHRQLIGGYILSHRPPPPCTAYIGRRTHHRSPGDTSVNRIPRFSELFKANF